MQAKPFAESFKDFLSSNELSFSAHVRNFDCMLPGLFAAEMGHGPGVFLGDLHEDGIYAALHRSTDVLQTLYERESELAFRLRGALEVLHKRHKLCVRCSQTLALDRSVISRL